ncbi:uncharacterized protein FSUBG_3756 [Fusarium subglutinans]|uniref:Uncharacterized protein n=1 Tax=Gibberella subglutinans TaxID=42677 RepID=A0A8H5Q6X6_GIBSU|nr:uncharacterized protein FSUBG_3756 [Fusarium subglutinans]KAF5609759.1 hypothetical protein FSUBG_3756 [Fusarium subglutinans]
MSGYSTSIYCAICGGPTSSHSAEPFTDYLSEPSLDSDDDSDWLDNVRLITQHPKSGRVFIVPRAEQEEANDFNVDFEENARIVRKDMNMMTVRYDIGGQDPLVFPFHVDCYELLGKVVKPLKIDNAALYRVLTSHLPRSYGPPNALDFNYGKVKRYQSDEWGTAPGIEYAIASPISTENVTSIVEHVLRKANRSNVQNNRPASNVPTGPSSSRDRSQNASTGPYQSYRAAPYHSQQRTRSQYETHQGPQRNKRDRQNRQAGLSRYSVHRDIPDTEWENKFIREFAWIREFLPSKDEIERRHVDRFLFCKAIFDLGGGRGFNAPEYRDTLRGLHNRRRLWELCSKIVAEYLPHSQQRSVQKPEATSSPEATRSRTASSVPASMPSMDFFRRPIKGSMPWPCEPKELRNKSPIEASSTETLTLAARDSDLKNAVRFGVDADMQRFEIHLEENGRKWSHCIGPRSTAMQYLYFDKSLAVPDRIIKCYVTMKHNIPVGLRFFSTQGQVIAAGKPGKDEIAYPREEDEGRGWLTGIFCQWSDRDSPDAKLASFGIYFAED